MTPAALAAQMAAIAIPPSVLSYCASVGLGVTSDTTVNGPPVDRTIVCTYAPTILPTATVGLVAGDASGAPMDPKSVVITNRGLGLFAAPRVGVVSPPNRPPARPGQCKASLRVSAPSAMVTNGGAGFVRPVATFVGGFSHRGGTPAQATLTQAGGHVTSITVTDPGSGYIATPTIVITDAGGPGAGAAATVLMELGDITIPDPGQGYQLAPSMTITPLFEAMFPTDATKIRATSDLIYRLMVAQLGPLKEIVTIV